jgi:hypothetical protein
LIDKNAKRHVGYSDFRLADIDFATVPSAGVSSDAWYYVGEGGPRGSSSSSHNLAATFGGVAFVLLIGVFVVLLPFRILIKKRRTELGYGLMCGMFVVCSALWTATDFSLVRINLGGLKVEIGVAYILALVIALVAKPAGQSPLTFKPIDLLAR